MELRPDVYEEVQFLMTKKLESTYSFQRTILTITSTLLGIIIALSNYDIQGANRKIVVIFYIASISSFSLGLIFLSIANYGEKIFISDVAAAKVGRSWGMDKRDYVYIRRHYVLAEYFSYGFVILGLVLIVMYSSVRML